MYIYVPGSSLSSIIPKAVVGPTICTVSGVPSVLLRTSPNASSPSSSLSSVMLIDTVTLLSPALNTKSITSES